MSVPARIQKHPLRPAPADIEYLYDGSFPGFLCCVFASVYGGEMPAAITPEAAAQPSLFAQRLIETDDAKAQRVEASVPAKISSEALRLLQLVFLSCMSAKELAMLRFLLLGFAEGRRVMQMLGHPDVAPLLEAQRHLLGENHLLTGFVRFSDYDGVLAAAISPKNFVLPLLAGHFIGRFPRENFMIYDKTHKAALFYENGKKQIVQLEGFAFPEADETEQRYRALWKRFYHTIAIEARENPRCRMTHMPKRYWENMTEMQELL